MTFNDQDEAEIEASRAPLMDHLIELRGRLIICVAAFIVAFIACFAFAEPIYVFLVRPFAAAAAFHAAAGGGAGVAFPPWPSSVSPAEGGSPPVPSNTRNSSAFCPPGPSNTALRGFSATRRHAGASCTLSPSLTRSGSPPPVGWIIASFTCGTSSTPLRT